MNDKTLALLEFDAIRSAVAGCALSAEAGRRIAASLPFTGPRPVAELKALVSRILDRINSGDEEPQGSIPDIAAILPKLDVEGASLEQDEAYALGIFIDRGGALKTWLAGGQNLTQAAYWRHHTDHTDGEKGNHGHGKKTGKNESVRVDFSAHCQKSEVDFSTHWWKSGYFEFGIPLTLEGLLAELPDCSPLAREVFRVFDREGKLRDLPEFRDIKRRIRTLTQELETAALRYTGSEETRRMLQSDLPSQRDGRLVLAVKANYRGRLRGIVHEVSSTGQTLFVEPEDVVEKNNDILIEQRRLDAEIRRVLRELTARIAEGRRDLGLFHEKIVYIETLRARARYSRDIRGHFALSDGARHRSGGISPGQEAPARQKGARHHFAGSGNESAQGIASRMVTAPLILKQARHPLLGRKAVPIDFTMGWTYGESGPSAGRGLSSAPAVSSGSGSSSDPGIPAAAGTGSSPEASASSAPVKTVIITGPNTGGKTVALKTIGLFALMNQFGLALPAAEGTALPVFDGIYADIGDEQSLSQSLSTFSAHMTNIAAIAAAAGADSLILLDELGSGTDPQEGSAIAMAILDHLIEKGSRIIVTTHHGVLKNYGYTRSGVENASVDFDRQTLSPTYRIVMGIPGESRAVDIAARNGVPEELIARARSYLANELSDVSALITELKKKHQTLDAAAEGAKHEAAKLREERRRADLWELRLKQKELELKEGGMGRLRLLLTESRKTLENLVREVKEGEITREKTLKVKEFLGDLEKAVSAEDAALEDEAQLLREDRLRLESNNQAESIYQNDRSTNPDRRSGRHGRKQHPVQSAIPIQPGAEVLAGEWKRRGTVIRADKGGWVVEIGSLRMTMDEKDLTPIVPSPEERKPLIEAAELSGNTQARFEISLRGMRLEEALDTLQRQIDAAVLSGLGEFSVVHGKGEGILQHGVHEYLKHQSQVADYYFSRPELGGFGRTEVILKR
ncbi:endonuclease MutS2 [Spirochaetia bacterium]|nr:endonuclease MutS2 [Spirochaetia bacterium]